MILKVRFVLDSAGIEIRPTEPIHLDGLLAWAVESRSGREYIPERNAVPTETDLPLEKYVSGEEWCWKARSEDFDDGERCKETRRCTAGMRAESESVRRKDVGDLSSSIDDRRDGGSPGVCA